VYTTKVRIDKPLPGLKPGMTANVEILVDRKPSVLTVPVLSVLQYHGKDHVTKKMGDRFESIEVDLGVANEKYVEVVKGLSEGDVIAMSPMSLMTDEEKRTAFGSAAKGGKKDWGSEEGTAEAVTKGAPGAAPPGAGKAVVGVPGKLAGTKD